jgi:hypothetical protein
LVGGFHHLEKYESQMGRIVPCIMENKSHVPNHQPAKTYIKRFSPYLLYISIDLLVDLDRSGDRCQYPGNIRLMKPMKHQGVRCNPAKVSEPDLRVNATQGSLYIINGRSPGS